MVSLRYRSEFQCVFNVHCSYDRSDNVGKAVNNFLNQNKLPAFLSFYSTSVMNCKGRLYRLHRLYR